MYGRIEIDKVAEKLSAHFWRFRGIGSPICMTASAVRREKAALSCGCKSHLAKAPASSNRSGYGGNDMAEAFG